MNAFQPESSVQIERHRSAIVRADLSRPVKIAVESDIFASGNTFFDFGCGHGGDIERVHSLGYESSGWDPYYRPTATKQKADIVNLGYVLNVIENPAERQQVLRESWNLASKVLIVSAQVLLNYLSGVPIAFGDGVLTKRNTFQKYFKQEELEAFIRSTLEVEPVPAGLGIFFVFREELDAEAFRASRYHARRSTPTVQIRTKRFEDFEQLLRPLMQFVSDRGRVPLPSELRDPDNILREFGSIHSAFQVVLSATNREEWTQLIEKRKQDLLVYMALANFSKRPRIGVLPLSIQQDIKVFFGTYKQGCEIADQMLFSLGQEGTTAKEARKSSIGKLVPDGLYVHLSALQELSPVLRLYEGCASRTIGRMEDATLVKFHFDKPKISYLFYPDFDDDPHPALHTSMRIDLRDLSFSVSEYSDSTNPPILHRKETFVSPSYKYYEKFSELTRAEEAAELLNDSKNIGTRNAWQSKLQQLGVTIEDHSVYRAGTSDKIAPATLPRADKVLAVTPTAPQPATCLETTSSRSTRKHHASSIPQEPTMTTDELKHFIMKQMSISHCYQPGIMLAVLEGNGHASISAAAAKCEELDGKPASTHATALKRYPIEALSKRGIIEREEPEILKLRCDLSNLSDDQKIELRTICKQRYSKKSAQ